MPVRYGALCWLLVVVPLVAQAAKPEAAPPTATPPPAASPPAFRLWTDTSGKFKVEAALVTADDKNVELRKKADGAVINVPRAKLSTKDRAYLAQLPKHVEPLPPGPAKDDGVLGIWEGKGENFTITLSIPKAGLASRMINFIGGEVAVGGYRFELADDGRSFAAGDASGTLDDEGQLVYADIVRVNGAAPVEVRMPLKRIATSAQLEAQIRRSR